MTSSRTRRTTLFAAIFNLWSRPGGRGDPTIGLPYSRLREVSNTFPLPRHPAAGSTMGRGVLQASLEDRSCERLVGDREIHERARRAPGRGGRAGGPGSVHLPAGPRLPRPSRILNRGDASFRQLLNGGNGSFRPLLNRVDGAFGSDLNEKNRPHGSPEARPRAAATLRGRCRPSTLRWRATVIDQEALKPPWVFWTCLLYTSPSPRDRTRSRMTASA